MRCTCSFAAFRLPPFWKASAPPGSSNSSAVSAGRLQSIARARGINVQPDPQPQRSVFTRSDQYSFVKEGIPAIMVDVAFPGEQANVQEQWLKNRYHAPSDDLNQPVDKASAGKYEDVVGAFMLAIADAPQRPSWKSDSFFRRFATE